LIWAVTPARFWRRFSNDSKYLLYHAGIPRSAVIDWLYAHQREMSRYPSERLAAVAQRAEQWRVLARASN
jgi:hypothetical protein